MKKVYLFLAMVIAGSWAQADVTGADPHSFSRPDKIVIRHMDLDLNLDFENEQINAEVRFELEQLQPVEELVLDTSELTIESVKEGPSVISLEETDFKVEEKQGIFGSPLKIAIQSDTKFVTIKYHTVPKAGVLGWLTPKQTTSGKKPFFFTHSQPIRARMWIPCQDTPTVRMSYSAHVQVPPGLLAVMSAPNPQKVNPDGIYNFEMKQPIPSYLIALAVGELEFKSLGERNGVYAEPQMLERAAKELEDLPKMMASAEELFGPYLWDRYDVLIMPTAFPALGMENPRLSFFYSGMIRGDKSGISVLAHELAHSWSGNLVTNTNWGDLWLNEGFTVYLERRILEKVYGKDFSEMLAVMGLDKLKKAISTAGQDLEVTKLHVELRGRDPRDNFSSIPYEKGYLFLRTIEESVGKERMNLFLKKYFENHLFKSVSSQDFVEYIRNTLFVEDPTLEEKISLEEWIFSPGMPSRIPEIQSEMLTQIKDNVQKWMDGVSAEELNIENWSVTQKATFLTMIPRIIPHDRLRELDRVFEFSKTNALNMLQEWAEKLIASQDVEQYALVENFLKYTTGNPNSLAAIYKSLAKSSPEGRSMAERIYAEAKDSYHLNARVKVEAVLKN